MIKQTAGEIDRQQRQDMFFMLLNREFQRYEIHVSELDHFTTVIIADHIPDQNFKDAIQNLFAGHWSFEYKLTHGN